MRGGNGNINNNDERKHSNESSYPSNLPNMLNNKPGETTTTPLPPSEMEKFIQLLPKIELHAHLNGCIRESSLLDLAKSKNMTLSPLLHNHQNHRRSLSECFEIFKEIHACVNDIQSHRRVVRETLSDFAADNVIYLELRSTPRCLFDCNKRDYVDVILKVMEEFETMHRGEGMGMSPRFVLSIDRSKSVEEAKETGLLAIELFRGGNEYVVGVDVGGDPTKNDIRDFLPVLKLVRDAGMKVSIHCGEVPCAQHPNDPNPTLTKAYHESYAIFQFRPDRIGHALFMPQSILTSLHTNPISIECCPTSNVMTTELSTSKHFENILEGLKQHPHLQSWLNHKYPIVISTDDPGVFGTNLTEEVLLVMHAFQLNEKEIWNLMINSIQYVFEQDVEFRCKLERRMKERMKELMRLFFE